MAYTFQTSSPEYHSATDKRSIAWGIALAAVLAIAIIFMMRAISREHAVVAPTGNSIIERVENSGTTEQQRTDTVPTTNPTDSTQSTDR